MQYDTRNFAEDVLDPRRHSIQCHDAGLLENYLFYSPDGAITLQDNPYLMLPPDMLHTVHSGLVRYATIWSLLFAKVVQG